MAIIILGATPCGICGRVLEEGEAIVAFPAFVSNRKDSLQKFHDAGFHQACFEADPLAGRAVARYLEIREHMGPENRRCIVCEQRITHPDDYFGISHLTSDSADPPSIFGRDYPRSGKHWSS